jgi:ketosteroid isomerase-like protein
MTTQEKEVKAVCDAWGRAMQEMDFGAHDALWIRDDEHFVYQPEEFERPCRTWEEFQKYLAYIPTAVTKVAEWRELETDIAIVGDAAIVYTLLHVVFEFKDVEEPFGGDVRFTLGLRRTEDGWRLFHCHESRQLVLDDPAAS